MTLATDGVEVLEHLKGNRYDVILMDLLMPKMGGLEATQRIHQQYAPGDRPHIIALSANAMGEHQEAALQAGMNDFVSKPVKVALLVEALRKCRALAPATPSERAD